MPPHRRPVPLPRRRGRLLVVVVAVAVAWAGAAGLAGTPYAAVVDALLDRLHAQPVPCPVDLDDLVLCFVADPARAAPLAETLEGYVAEFGGALRHGPWLAGNATYRVTLWWSNDAVGGLEVWLTEVGPARVEGRFELVPRRRD